jgi:hypothetical protein
MVLYLVARGSICHGVDIGLSRFLRRTLFVPRVPFGCMPISHFLLSSAIALLLFDGRWRIDGNDRFHRLVNNLDRRNGCSHGMTLLLDALRASNDDMGRRIRRLCFGWARASLRLWPLRVRDTATLRSKNRLSSTGERVNAEMSFVPVKLARSSRGAVVRKRLPVCSHHETATFRIARFFSVTTKVTSSFEWFWIRAHASTPQTHDR